MHRFHVGSALLLVTLLWTPSWSQEPCEPMFTGGSTYAVGSNFGHNLLRDFNGDGHLDLTVGIIFHLGDGTGSFGAPIRLSAPWPDGFDMQFRDFDADGLMDAAIAGFADDEIMFYYGKRNEEDPTDFFEPGVRFPVRTQTPELWHIDSADFNNDGLPDLCGVSFFGGPRSIVVINQGNRQYELSSLGGSGGGHMLTTGDFNGDGNADIAQGLGREVKIYAGRGDGTFPTSPQTGNLGFNGRAAEGHRFRSADFDGDGRSELVASANTHVLVYKGADFDDETADLPSTPAWGLSVLGSVRFVEPIDLNNDGFLDIMSLASSGSTSRYRSFYGYLNEEGEFDFVLGDSRGTTLSGPASVLAVGDVDEDGFADMVVTTEDNNRGRTFLNDASCAAAELFERGDANADTQLDLTDGIAILESLFLGEELTCPGAAEVNDDGELNLADAVYLLGYLFLGLPAPLGESPVACEVPAA